MSATNNHHVTAIVPLHPIQNLPPSKDARKLFLSENYNSPTGVASPIVSPTGSWAKHTQRGKKSVDFEEAPPTHLKIVHGPDDISNFDAVSLISEQTDDFGYSKYSPHGGYHKNFPDHNVDSTEVPKYITDEDLPSKTCLPGGFFWRSKGSRKVACADVASVGNASDTLISVSSKARMSGRDLHESAKVTLNAGEHNKALSMFESILEAQLKRFGQKHPSVGAAMHNVGVVHLRMGHHAVAESFFSESVQIRKQSLGGNHLEVAASLSKLGSARVALHKFDEALANLREAHKIAKSNVGDKHKTVAQILCKMACLYFEAGELLASQATFTDALEIYRATWSQDGDQDACLAQLTDTLCNIGSIQNKRRKFSQAIVSFSEALDLQRTILGDNHPNVIATLDNLAFSHSKNRDYALASSYYNDMLKAQISHYGTFSEDCLDTLKKQILMFEKLKTISGALDAANEALRLQQSMLPPDDKVILHTREMLEHLQLKMERVTGRHLAAI